MRRGPLPTIGTHTHVYLIGTYRAIIIHDQYLHQTQQRYTFGAEDLKTHKTPKTL